MLLTEIISSLELLFQPTVSLNKQGLQLSYPDHNGFQLMLAFIPLSCDLSNFITDKQANTLIIPHREVFRFLLDVNANEMGLKDAIESFYLAEEAERAKLLAHESLHRLVTDKPMSNELLTFERVALGPRPNQLIADMTIKMPPAILADDVVPSRVVFLLDRSGSMIGDRMNMLKPAVIGAINKLPPTTLVSVYFYNSTLMTICENTAVAAITEEHRENILNTTADDLTCISVAIKALAENIKKEGLLTDPRAFENLTVVWLTDGEDDRVKKSDDLVKLFHSNGCDAMPQLITVGVGSYNQKLLNGIAEDIRFKSNLMLHIDAPENTGKLFDMVARCVGVMRKKVIVVMEAAGRMTFEDLGVLQAGQVKKLLMEIPMPAYDANQVTCRLLFDEQVNVRETSLPEGFNYQNTDLLVAYFTQLQNKITLAMHTNPTAAEAMRECALISIPSTVHDRRLQALRKLFMPEKSSGLTSGQGFFSPMTQASYSQSLQNQYTPNP